MPRKGYRELFGVRTEKDECPSDDEKPVIEIGSSIVLVGFESIGHTLQNPGRVTVPSDGRTLLKQTAIGCAHCQYIPVSVAGARQ
jgi:hypothetical protein